MRKLTNASFSGKPFKTENEDLSTKKILSSSTSFYRASEKQNNSIIWKWKQLPAEYSENTANPILLNTFTGQIFCPLHCRWESSEILSDFEIKCISGRSIKGLVVPFFPDPKKSFAKTQNDNHGMFLLKTSRLSEEFKVNYRKAFFEYPDSESENKSVFKTKYDSKNQKFQLLDAENISYDIFLYTFFQYDSKQTLILSTNSLNREKIDALKEGNLSLSRIPVITSTINYDFKIKNREKIKDRLNGTYSPTEKTIFPAILNEYAETEAENILKNFYEKDLRVNKNYYHGVKLLEALSNSPYEANMYPFFFRQFYNSRYLPEWFNKDDSDIYNTYCKFLKIKSFPSLRKCFEANPETITIYKNMRDIGFNDLNVIIDFINNCISEKFNLNETLNEWSIDDYKFFVTKALKTRSEKSILNAIFREKEMKYNDRDDIAMMFARYYDYLKPEEQQMILKDGFTRRNHDMLVKIVNQLKNKNIIFKYEKKQLKFNDTIQDFEFNVPKDSDELHEIGSKLHNCVFSYKDRVLMHECTIVSVRKNNEYIACIEISPKLSVVQARGNFNSDIPQMLQEANKIWCEKHNLKDETQ